MVSAWPGSCGSSHPAHSHPHGMIASAPGTQATCGIMDVRARLDAALGDRYRCDREVGSGGSAHVFLARDLKHDRPVALKVLRPELAQAVGTERFLREIEIAARLNHPNILALHDSGEADGLLYFVMPFLEGESLRDRLRREGHLPVAEAIEIAREIASALEYAHGQGLVHRDVKPENVMFQAGHAVVCDFGIARAASEAEGGLTRTGMAIGTLAYMSPEQATGEGTVDGRTDLYALACVVYEMLTGEHPFGRGGAQASLGRKLVGTIDDVSRTRSAVPATVDAVLRKALAPEPDDRFTSARSFAEALSRATTEFAVEDERRRRRQARWWRAAALVAGLVLAGAAGWRLIQGGEMQRVAVMPFDTTGDPQQAAFVAGIHQDLVLELAKAGLRVINPGSMGRFRDTDRPLDEIAADLGVDRVIQGTATHVADSVGLNLTLIDPRSGELLWGESFGAPVREIVGLYRNVTSRVATEMGAELAPEVRERLATAQEVDPQVYEWLLRARFSWQQLDAEGLSTALEYYEQVLERDSTSIEAWQGVANVWGVRQQEGLVPPDSAQPRRDSALARARAIDPTFSGDPAGLAIRKTWMEWSWAEAEAAFTRALEDDPSDAATRAYYALFLLYTGRPDEAEEQTLEAASTDPFSSLVQGLHAQALNALRRHADAERVMRRVLSRDPEDPFALSTLRTTYHLMGRDEEAIEMWRASYGRTDDEEALAALERGWAEDGYEAALREVADLMVARSDTVHVRPWSIGTLYTRAGEVELALDYLERAFEEQDSNIPYLTVDPIFDPLRDEPRFEALIERLEIPPPP